MTEGIAYNTKNETVLIPGAYAFYEQIASLKRVLSDSNNDKGGPGAGLSCYVASTGIEPVSGASETLILSIVLRGRGAFTGNKLKS